MEYSLLPEQTAWMLQILLSFWPTTTQVTHMTPALLRSTMMAQTLDTQVTFET